VRGWTQPGATARKADSIEAVLRAVRAIPGVAAAGFAYAGIMIGVQDTVGSFVAPGRTIDAARQDPDRPRLKSLSAGYLEAAGVRLLAGRLIRESDSAQAPPAVVINRTVQRRYFGDANPVGAFMDWHGPRGPHVPVQVVGVIGDVRQRSQAREPYPEIFMDYSRGSRFRNAGAHGSPRSINWHSASCPLRCRRAATRAMSYPQCVRPLRVPMRTRRSTPSCRSIRRCSPRRESKDGRREDGESAALNRTDGRWHHPPPRRSQRRSSS
jgi:hypothetical protein